MESNVIVALDLEDLREIEERVKELSSLTKWFKIGYQMISSIGIKESVRIVKSFECNVFLDMKLYDIPNTVSKAIKNLTKLDIDMITIHVSGGPKMIKEALNSVDNKSKVELLGVTLLTSFSEEEAKKIYNQEDTIDIVKKFVRIGYDAGLRGFVCSPHELKPLKKEFPDCYFVVPGIRPSWSFKYDQERFATPYEAKLNGATYIVVGRPVIKPGNNLKPTDALKSIIEEFSK
ncbi:orotidine 5'-phosphate decarboxylase [Thermodesulfobium narugense DSM 14796]|uniref:Orotidine 5'-phosphate decarboxylase n=1 Tax=Thermodesulfobium narugense DSM 14796 TaxID=747365 RepID=M1E607_9BACT|nr:orotidine-5'-phosphate decarboxylase [Thermodesulfobium narugense]AEE14586.1 orotidine 5'-phosphate decarboxylase [Thermodesulfobium narugense DSM 14796]